MNWKTFNFNELQNSRYELTVVYNGVRYQLSNTISGSILEKTMHITYAKMMEELRGQLCIDNKNKSIQQYRNHCTAINGFMSFVGKTDEDRVGLEFKDNFDVTLNAYLESCSVGDRTKSDRRSLMNRWRSVYTGIEQRTKIGTKPNSDFTAVLKQALVDSGLTQAAVIEMSRVNKSVFRRWLNGAQPNSRNYPAVRRLENVLNLKRDTLINLIRKPNEEHGLSFVSNSPYRNRVRDLVRKPYQILEKNVSDNLRDEWLDYFRYKTTERPRLRRNGSWRLRPKEECRRLSGFSILGPMGCPTAKINWDKVRSFMGYLYLPVEQGGYGLSLSDTQTLSLLVVPDFLQGYLEFKTHRSGGIKHGGMQGFAANIISMTAPETGYLALQPHFHARLPEMIRQQHPDWAKLCAEANELAKHWKRISKEKSRDPTEPIAGILSIDEPFEVIFRMIRAIDDKAASYPAGGMRQAVCKRDALLIALIMCNPMRLSNFENLTWNSSNFGNLYRTSDRQWRVRYKIGQMKNDKGTDMKLPDWVVPRLEEYLEEFRDVILQGASSNHLFVSRDGKVSKWGWMDKAIKRITKTYARETPGFGIHAFRHLIATVMLTNNPEGWLTVAEILGDDINTVMKHYAHLKRDASFERYESELEKFTDGFVKKDLTSQNR